MQSTLGVFAPLYLGSQPAEDGVLPDRMHTVHFVSESLHLRECTVVVWQRSGGRGNMG